VDDRDHNDDQPATDIGLNDPLDPEVSRGGPEPADPQYVWVRFQAETAPHDGLDYVTDPPFRRRADPSLGGDGLVRALTELVGTVQRAVGFAMSSSGQPQTGGSAGPYSTANLPPGVTARAFSDAVRRKRVRVAVVSGRNMVLATDWDNYVASCAKKSKPVRASVTDDELLASVGSRKGGRE
jgi:hypothetical protein